MTKFSHPEQVTLSNGIPVVLQNYEGSVATIYWWVQVGSADEAPKEAGFAHFLEHMHFKDAAAKESGRASTGEMARAIESLGGDINAYTSFDQTVYHVTCAAQHWEKVLDDFGTIAKPQRFLKKDFEREREVVLEELRKNEDSPGRQLFQSLFSNTFGKHPYGRPVIGNVRTLKAATTSTLENFYRRNYVTGKMGLILVGPLQDAKGARRKALLKGLEKRFGAAVLRPISGQRLPRVKENPIRDRAQMVLKPFDVKTPTLSFAFRAPELAHEDLPALDLLSSILGAGELSRLYQKLFNETSLVTDVSSGLYVPKDPGLLYLQAEMESIDRLNLTAKTLIEELNRLRMKGPEPEEIERVLVNAESERLYSTQTVDGLAGRLGFLKFVMGDLGFDQEYLDQLRAVTPSQIQAVAHKYLEYRRMSGVVMVPKSESKFDLAEIENAVTVLKSDELEPSKSTRSKLRFSGKETPELLQLPSGLRVCFHPRPQSHVMSIHASVLGGLRLEVAHPIESVETDWGASYLMALSWNKGTPSLDAKKISAIVEGHAASLEGFAGRNSVGLQLTGLAKNWERLSGLFNDVLLQPVFPEDEVNHARRIAEDSLRTLEDHSSQLCSKLFLETLFESHPYGRMTQGSLESLAALQSKKLQAYHRRWIRPDRLVISLSGAIKTSAVESFAEDLDRRLQEKIAGIPKGEGFFDVDAEPDLKAPRWVERPKGREQLHILMGGLGIKTGARDRYALRLLQTLLGGQSGRLFVELREKKSLAYTVSPLSFEGVERGYVGTYMACAPQKKEEALSGIREVLEHLAKKGPTSKEMERAREFYLGKRAMDLQSDSALAGFHGLEILYGGPRLTDEEIIKQVRSVSARDLQVACRKYFVEPHMVTSVVG